MSYDYYPKGFSQQPGRQMPGWTVDSSTYINKCIAVEKENENMNNSGDSEAVEVCADSPDAGLHLTDDKRHPTVSTRLNSARSY